MLPVSSNTVASTSGFIPRRLTGRAPIARTCTATVAASSTLRPLTVRASLLALGRCSSSAPTLVSPSVFKPSATLPEGATSGAFSRDGRGQRTGASRSCALVRSSAEANARGPRPPADTSVSPPCTGLACTGLACAGLACAGLACTSLACADLDISAPHDALHRGRRLATGPSLGGQQPPVRGLSTLAHRQSDGALEHRFDFPARHRRVLADQAADQFGALGQHRDHHAQRVRGIAPSADLLADEPDRVAAPESSLGVVAGGARDRACAHARERFRKRPRVVPHAPVSLEGDSRHESRLLPSRGG